MLSILRNNPFSKHVARHQAVRQEIQPIEFDDEAIMSKLISVPVRFYGYYLRVPAGTHAVVTYPSGHLRIFREGDRHLNLPSGNYEMRYVNMKELILPLEVQGETRDGWPVALQLNVFWRVADASKIVVLDSPMNTLHAWCTSAAMDYLRSKTHDRLAQPSARGPISDQEIAADIREQLYWYLISRGFEVVDVIPADRQGDGRISRAWRQAEVQKHSLAFQTSVMAAQQEADVRQLEMDQELSRMRAGQAFWDAQREVEIDHVRQRRRVNEANVELEVQGLLGDIRRQQWEWDQEALAEERKHELLKESIAASGTAIGQVSGAILESQRRGVQQGDAANGTSGLGGTLENLTANLSVPANGTGRTANSGNGRSGGSTLEQLLRAEVLEVLALPEEPLVGLHQVRHDLWVVRAEKDAVSITISCREGYPERRPQAQYRVGQNGMAIPVQASILERTYTLADIVRAVLAQVRSEQPGDGRGRGTQRPPRMSAD